MGSSSSGIMRDVKRFGNRIADTYKARKIILFGSQATGRTREGSDIDLIVVSPLFRGGKAIWGMRRLNRVWHRELKIGRPVDILCYSPEEFERQRKRITIVRQAVEEGIEIA